MKRNPLFIAVFAGLMMVLAHPAMAAYTDRAEAFIRSLVDDAIDALNIPPEAEAEREATFRRLIHQHFDVPTITQRVVGRAWLDATPEEREAFAQVFEEHILTVYASQLGAYQGEVVQFRRAEALSDAEVVVFTEVVRSDGPTLRLDWRVHDAGGGELQVIDVAADGASLLRAKRDEFRQVLQREGLGGLTERLRALNERHRQAAT